MTAPWDAVLGGHDPRSRRRRGTSIARLAGLADRAVVPWGPTGYLVSVPGRPMTFCSDMDKACRSLAHRWARAEKSAGHRGPADESAELRLRQGADLGPILATTAAWLAHSAPSGKAVLVLPQQGWHQGVPGRVTVLTGPSPALGLHGDGAISFARLVTSRIDAFDDASALPTRLEDQPH